MKHFLVPLSLLLLSTLLPRAQAQTLEPRLAGVIREEVRALLPGSRTPRAALGQDRGPLAPETAIPGIALVFKRSAEREAALQQLLAAQQDPASPLFHQWLTPETFATRFGIAGADLAATESWLRSHGFRVDGVSRARDRITFSGTAAQVQAAFGTELRQLQFENELHFAPAADISLPADLAAITAAVLHLSDFRPKPSIKIQTRPQPLYTGGSNQAHYLVPADLLTMYHVPAPAANILPGSGQALAVMGQSFVNTSNSSSVGTFQSLTSVGTTITTVIVPGSGVEAISPGDEGESEIDLEYASGIASGARIFLVHVGANQNYSVFDSLSFAIQENIAPVLSLSYGGCEALYSATELDQGNALFEQANAQGQTIVVSSGDDGSTACAPFPASTGITPAQRQALAVSYPASSPYVTAVGGTEMTPGTFAAGPSPYWKSVSYGDVTNSLLSYVPEAVWNEGSASLGILASGGGASARFGRPFWQTNFPGIPSGNLRLLPDISLQSSIQSPGFLICSSDYALVGSQSTCTSGLRGSTGQYAVAGGTSFAAPVFAGLVTILNQLQQATGQGNVNPELYTLAAAPATYSTVFHDITTGGNACVAGVTACSASGQSGYAATPGYDQATGLGSLDFTQLLAAWPATPAPPRQTAGLFFQIQSSGFSPGSGGAIPVPAGTSIPLQIGITPPIPFKFLPTGTLTLYVDGIQAQSSRIPGTSTLDNVTNYNFTAPAATGTHLLKAVYSGDAGYAPNVSTLTFLVGTVTATGSFTLSAGNLTIPNGGTATGTVTIIPAAGYTGRLTWSLSYTGATSITGCYAINSPAINGTGISTATLNFGVGSPCSAPAPAARPTLQMIAPPAANTIIPRPQPWQRPALALAAGLLLCGTFVPRQLRTRLPILLAILFLTLGSLHLTGCGGSSATAIAPPPTPAPTAATYTFTLKATDSVNTALSSSTTFTLTVD